jgi:hypothetical protein
MSVPTRGAQFLSLARARARALSLPIYLSPPPHTHTQCCLVSTPAAILAYRQRENNVARGRGGEGGSVRAQRFTIVL